ncbi:hypothetical protein HMPREF0519_1026 [Lentilactobacillus hilgardii DSM 20176 = ATCC 8290]|uniref:Uncharacterized protein n=1 Tax=Lentilactobacillus hilgardii (strain ATCC 8290 / DSM 20176 / CCUG 30140 / JCM 1155 / KCTC 3500 / NBRC 15886 / NCIMB 8040 / NRRL B-1843 / 9) TaxID=1423757 RepID=C0XIG5_LENH9|nr:hypothetical protein HMPREF0519_1026 [Lentilactobacillus hilgardii DSM 20176 = ATCC 8290]
MVDSLSVKISCPFSYQYEYVKILKTVKINSIINSKVYVIVPS